MKMITDKEERNHTLNGSTASVYGYMIVLRFLIPNAPSSWQIKATQLKSTIPQFKNYRN